jgi:hypothetical protein
MRRAILSALLLALPASAALSLVVACDEEVETCRAGEQLCPGVGCVNTSNSTEHCGLCGHECQGCDRCIMGECTPACCSTEFNCGTIYELDCVNLDTSREHCGQCDNACTPAQFCLHRECADCAPPRQVCANACADLMTDIQHCGECSSLCYGVCHCGTCYEEGEPVPDAGCGDGDADVDSDVDSDVDADAEADASSDADAADDADPSADAG